MSDAVQRRFFKFIAVGVINTAVGVAIIAGGIILGLPPVAANALGFVLGLCLSFALNARLTFAVAGNAALFARYLLAFLVAYAGNLAVVLTLDRLFPGHALIVYVLGIVPYTIIFFLLAEYFVFRRVRAPDARVPGRG